jgi:hypothetical protein
MMEITTLATAATKTVELKYHPHVVTGAWIRASSAMMEITIQATAVTRFAALNKCLCVEMAD